MEFQEKLFEKNKRFVINLTDEPDEVKVVRNRFLTAGALIVEEIIKKRWIKPMSVLRF